MKCQPACWIQLYLIMDQMEVWALKFQNQLLALTSATLRFTTTNSSKYELKGKKHDQQ